ncbi:NlpC/P60 family protein [Streptomyces collinus]|uniref:NlpC/P60 family protein n=1 Tax=Streptomyces collinus TaxID=42684 RepID=UPI0036C9D937
MAPESPDEVRQRIDSLYSRAENATGNYNATRAMAAATRSRGVPLAKRSGRRTDPELDAVSRQWFDGARAKLGPTVPAALPADRQPARPAAPARSRDWADSDARESLAASLGLPELPSARSADRPLAELPPGPSAAPAGRPRPALEAGTAALPAGRSTERPGHALELPGPYGWTAAPAADRGAPVADLGTVTGPGLPQLTGPGVVAPLALGAPGTTVSPELGGPARLAEPGLIAAEFSPPGAGPRPGSGGALGETAVLPAGPLPPTPVREPRQLPVPSGAPGRPSPGDFKATNRRKLALARDVLSRHIATLGAAPTAVPAAPDAWGTGVQDLWDTGAQAAWNTGARQALPSAVEQSGQWQQPARSATGQWTQPQWGASTAMTPQDPAASLPTATPGTDTGAFASVPQTGRFAPVTDTGSYPRVAAGPVTDTGSYPQVAAGPVTNTGSYPQVTAGPVTDTGSYPQVTVGPLTDTGSYPQVTAGPVTNTGSYPQVTAGPVTDTGSYPQVTTGPVTNTGSYAAVMPDPLTSTGSYAPVVIDPVTDTGSYAPVTNSPWPGTGSFANLTTPPAATANAVADTGSYAAGAAAVAPTPTPAPAPAWAPTPAPLGTVPQTTDAVRVAKAIAFARAQVGKPCVWGAMGPGSYDCSSLTQAAWRAAGVTLPRAAHEQALAGTPVTLAGLEPGDLVLFFDDDRHVGLHIGDGVMVHAPGPGASIREESIYGAGEAAIHRVIRPA